jgi:uncharacterized protein YciI
VYADGVLYVTFYATDLAQLHRIAEVYPRHRAHVDDFARGGQIWMIGNFGDPVGEGAMCIFRSLEGAEQFLASDPFVLEGIVAASSVREWEPLVYEGSS